MRRLALSLSLAFLLAACAIVPQSVEPRDIFWERLQALCGRAYAGRVVSTDPGDRELAASRLVIYPHACTPASVRIAFHAGANASRTWLVTRTATGLSLTHIHRTREGVEEVRSRYGGATVLPGTTRRQDFPADARTRALFQREDIAAAASNVWSLEIVPDRMLGYAVDRPDRHLRIEFDLTRPVASPGPAWGER